MMPPDDTLDRPGKAPVPTNEITKVIMAGAVVHELGLEEIYFLIQCELRIPYKLVVIIILVQLETGNLSNVMNETASVGGFMPLLAKIFGNGTGGRRNTHAMLPHVLQ